MTGLITREDDGGVAVIWRDRPCRLNAMHAALRAELTEAVRAGAGGLAPQDAPALGADSAPKHVFCSNNP